MKKIFALLALLFVCSPLFAQSKAKPVDVNVRQVNDRRTNGSFSQLMIVLELPKMKASDIAAARVLVDAASDDSGKSLIDEKEGEPQLDAVRSMDATSPATISFTMKNPARKATQIKEVRGEIELFMPGKDPNSVAEVAKFVSTSGKPITHKALKANGVEIALLSPAQIDAERKKIADAKRKEYKDSGWEGEDLENMVKSIMESTLKVDEGELVVRIKDPNQRIQEISYVDASGETKHVSKYDDEGLTKLSTWGDKPQPDWKLRVSMKTPNNLARYAFAIRNVPLP